MINPTISLCFSFFSSFFRTGTPPSGEKHWETCMLKGPKRIYVDFEITHVSLAMQYYCTMVFFLASQTQTAKFPMRYCIQYSSFRVPHNYLDHVWMKIYLCHPHFCCCLFSFVAWRVPLRMPEEDVFWKRIKNELHLPLTRYIDLLLLHPGSSYFSWNANGELSCSHYCFLIMQSFWWL